MKDTRTDIEVFDSYTRLSLELAKERDRLIRGHDHREPELRNAPLPREPLGVFARLALDEFQRTHDWYQERLYETMGLSEEEAAQIRLNGVKNVIECEDETYPAGNSAEGVRAPGAGEVQEKEPP